MTTTPATTRLWLLDLDGVVWLGDEAIPGAADAIRRLRAAGRRVAFFTNNSFASRHQLSEKFAAHDIEAADDDILSSAQAAAQLIHPNQRVFVLGGDGILEALRSRGIAVQSGDEQQPPDVVVVGLDRELQFARLTSATRGVHQGARLIGTNDDATYPTPDGPLPGGGALLAAVAYATGVTPVVAGKPHQPAADLVAARFGTVEMMVGDRPSTDGLFARRLGAQFGLVRSGVTAPGVAVHDPVPDVDAPDLATLVDRVLDGPS